MEIDMSYKYEVHMHTAQGSACSRINGEDYIAEFMRLGYDGMIVTDHFYHGNTAVSRSLPWEDYIENYCKGYERAKAEGDKYGFKVFFGWEESQGPDEYLIYGLDKEWLLAHPEIKEADHVEYLRLVHESGGLVVGAHPFRERAYVDVVKLHPFQCDAMEVCNFGNPPYQDILAYNFCRDRGIVMTSGTDLHDVAKLEGSLAGMVFEEPLESIKDYVARVRAGKGFTPLIPEDRRVPMTPDIVNTLPMRLYDEKNEYKEVTAGDLFPYVK